MIDLRSLRADVSFIQPKLIVESYKRDFVLSGKFVVSDGPSNDGPLAEFDIMILVPSDFPKREPVVWETAGKLPNDIDRHTYSNSACCTCVWPEWLATNPHPTMRSFLEGPVYNFFLSQLYFETFETWPFGEREHGVDGVVQAVATVLETERLTLDEAVGYLRVLSARHPKGHFECPCGSGKKLRACHFDYLGELRARLAPEPATKFLRILTNAQRLAASRKSGGAA